MPGKQPHRINRSSTEPRGGGAIILVSARPLVTLKIRFMLLSLLSLFDSYELLHSFLHAHRTRITSQLEMLVTSRPLFGKYSTYKHIFHTFLQPFDESLRCALVNTCCTGVLQEGKNVDLGTERRRNGYRFLDVLEYLLLMCFL